MEEGGDQMRGHVPGRDPPPGQEGHQSGRFGKYALELCLHVLDDQDIDQELSISEFMQNNRLPLAFKYKFKDGMVKNITFSFTETLPAKWSTLKRAEGS